VDYRRNAASRRRFPLIELANDFNKLKTKEIKTMKTKFYWIALLASAALIAQAKAGGHNGGGGGGGGGGFAGSHVGGGGGAHFGAPGFSSGPRGNFGGGRFMAPGPRFSSYHTPMAFRQQRVGDFDRGFAGSRQFATGTANRRFDAPRTFNHQQNGLTRNGNNSRFENRSANGARDHLFARHSADWHRDWDRHQDHWWHGHRCRFVDGSWFIYDFGFYPYDYWYPYDYYAYDYYPYEYDAGAYEGDGSDYYGQGAYESSGQYADPTIAGAQDQLARQGYYRGQVDGVFGPATRRAITRYQGDHGLRVTGTVNTDTLRALGLPRTASN
jgi:Putative peptidoglycan binding domain